jgi:hypothetical protein
MEMSSECKDRLVDRLLTVCRDYEPWADMMYWSGGGDHGVYDFPLDFNQVEKIEVTFGNVEEEEGPITSLPDVK